MDSQRSPDGQGEHYQAEAEDVVGRLDSDRWVSREAEVGDLNPDIVPYWVGSRRVVAIQQDIGEREVTVD
jgi:hypothetical protein